MMRISAIGLVWAAALSAWAQTPNLAFKSGAEGAFTFDTGRLRGVFKVTPNDQAVASLVDSASGIEITKGKSNLGLFNIYRFMGTDKRWGDIIWQMPKTAKLRPDGSLEVHWPAQPDRPIELTAVYALTSPDGLEGRLRVAVQENAPRFELFIGNYFADRFRSFIYAKPAMYAEGEKEDFLPLIASPLIYGTYLAFPRDLASARPFFDGRWLRGNHNVQWTVGRYLAAPLAMQKDVDGKLAVLLMSRPKDCFGMETSYNRENPSDNVADHHSTYFSLFGDDVRAGQTLEAVIRAEVLREPATPAALDRYRAFLEQNK